MGEKDEGRGEQVDLSWLSEGPTPPKAFGAPSWASVGSTGSGTPSAGGPPPPNSADFGPPPPTMAEASATSPVSVAVAADSGPPPPTATDSERAAGEKTEAGEKAERPPRIVGLDGIRALAAGLVLAYHLVPGWRGSGYVGVDMFFVLSGFLITSLLLRDLVTRGKVRLKDFWMRRIRRIMPAVVFATVGTVALARIGGGDSLVQLPWQVAGSLTNTYNWFQVWNAAPYFGQRSPLLLANMWSLSVEMQFYLVWPLLVVAIAAYAPRKAAPYIALGIGAFSAGLNWYFVHVADDITRAYVGTDSHAFGLMMGAAIAFWVPKIMVEKVPQLDKKVRDLWGILSWVGLIGAMAIGIFVVNGPWMYPWGMVAAAGFTALTVRAMLPDAHAKPSLVLARFLNSKPMVWFGERSYSVYLWHWPLWVIAFFTFKRDTLLMGFFVLIISVAMAEVSFRYVETPIRLHGVKTWVASMMPLPRPVRITLSTLSIVVVALFTWAMFTSPAQSSTEALFEAAEAGGEVHEAEEPEWSLEGAGLTPPLKDRPAPEIPEPDPIAGDQVTVIGDSVTLVSEPQLQERLPGVFIDSEVSRPMLSLPSVAESVRAQGMMREYVVISLAVNGFVRDEEISAMFDAIGPDHKIVLVTGYGPQSEHWIFEANEKIYEVGEEHKDQVRIADWAPIAAANHDLLAGDLTHPGPAGSALYADEIVTALNSFNY